MLTLKVSANLGAKKDKELLKLWMTELSKIFLPHCRNSASGSSKQFVWMPNAHNEIISVVNLAAKSFTSITSSLTACSLRRWSNPLLHSTKVGNIIFIFPDVNVGDNLLRKRFHFGPPIEKRWAEEKLKTLILNLYFGRGIRGTVGCTKKKKICL